MLLKSKKKQCQFTLFSIFLRFIATFFASQHFFQYFPSANFRFTCFVFMRQDNEQCLFISVFIYYRRTLYRLYFIGTSEISYANT